MMPWSLISAVAKKRSLFDDRPVEIQELTYIIKQDINNLNQQIARLQQYQLHNSAGAGQSQQHNTNVVVSLQSRLAAMSTSFKGVLETRTEVCSNYTARSTPGSPMLMVSCAPLLEPQAAAGPP